MIKQCAYSFCINVFEGEDWKTICPDCYNTYKRPRKTCTCGDSFSSKYNLCQTCYEKEKSEKHEESLLREREEQLESPVTRREFNDFLSVLKDFLIGLQCEVSENVDYDISKLIDFIEEVNNEL